MTGTLHPKQSVVPATWADPERPHTYESEIPSALCRCGFRKEAPIHHPRSRRPRLLDLFCGAGGCSVGYHRAGFDVVGVDIEPHPDYPFEMHVADAMTFPLDGFDAIHASPPCQAFTAAGVIHGNDHHADLLTPTRKRLLAQDAPWVIENVPGAPMRKDLVLCGSMFDLRSKHGRLIRHRWFEFSFPFFALVNPCQHDGPTISVFGHGGHVYHGVADWREVMGIDWMKRDDLAQAIPPAYTEFIGGYLLAEVNNRALAKAA